MEELLAKTHNLQVTDDEEWEIDKSLSITIAKCNLQGRLCTTTEHSRSLLKKVLGGIWRLKEAEWNLKIKEKYESGLFLTFTFASESIQNRILTKMPWYLSNGVLILGKMENSNESWNNDLINFPIWGRALGVPIDLLTTNNARKMAAKTGEVITVNNSDISKMVADGFFRFRVVNAYGTWLKSESSCRDRFQGHQLSMDNQKLQGNHTTKQAMGVTHDTVIHNSFGPLEDTLKGVEKMITDLESQQESMATIKDGGKIQMIQAKDKISSDKVQERENVTWDDNGRGKRRMVDNMEFTGYEKTKKSNTSMATTIPENNLFNVPISYSMEAQNLEGSASFVVGSNSKEMSKENRRKVSVKKDSKAKKGKIVDLLCKNGTEGKSET
ncbi:hypothetical protein G4B88_030544 [Cannabis sativa]|uniref:DUF4283 domain-containing protein n=1 Tax=Cannabis sativa TaxID=3483 RepID=A0A7J6EKI2_CANSA|nr:hypothetical protein G4B88_030544 [Cannabis sativa]